MKPFQLILRVLTVLIIGVLLTGCNTGKTTEESRKSMIQAVDPEPVAIQDKKGKNQDIAEDIKKEIQKLPHLYDVAVIKGEKEILVAYKVKHMQRFHMKKIEKEINEKLEKKYPKENFIVSSDYKIFIEVLELKEKMKDPNFSKEKAEKRLQKIVKFQEELT
jgi:hypothetical protein